MNDRLGEIFAEIFRYEGRMGDSLSPGDVKGWDSLGHLALVTALEEKFGIRIADEDSMEMTNVAAIKRILSALGVPT